MSTIARAHMPVADLAQREDDAEYFEYTSSADPLGARLISRVPFRSFPASLYESGPSRAIVLDLAQELGIEVPATGPSLRAHFVRVAAGERLSLDDAPTTSQVAYVIRGSGELRHGDERLRFGEGDIVALPSGAVTILAAETVALYYVNDAPLLHYLGVAPVRARFAPTHYPAARARDELRKIADDPRASKRNRISVLLGNRRFPQTRTVTHVLWAMFGIVPAHAQQKAHRHQSIALDFIVDCQPGCYSLVGKEVDASGTIVRPTRVDWEPGMAFVTPPGYWHAHFNESAEAAHLIPIQDAGLHTYLRSLDIKFASSAMPGEIAAASNPATPSRSNGQA